MKLHDRARAERGKIYPQLLAVAAMLTLGFITVVATPGWTQVAAPFSAHQGLVITRAFTSSFGPDAEEFNRFAAVTEQYIELDYSDTRGTAAKRRVLRADSERAKTYLIGFDPRVPLTVPGTTSLGISSAALRELRATGRTRVALMYDTKLSTIDGELTVADKGIKIPVLIENQIVPMAAIRVRGVFRSNNRSGMGEFIFLDDVKQPLLIEYNIRFSFEKLPRTVRTVRLTAGQSQQSAMARTLATVRKLDVYGIHFDFDKAQLQSRSSSLISDIAQTLRLNPRWTLEIRGHTDSIGSSDHNLQLSKQRAEAVRQALIAQHGIASNRLRATGVGASQPKESNDSLQGRAMNRRVELARTDR
jgi:outer membrane protein OmpA-like peptidoglycan-associated protein